MKCDNIRCDICNNKGSVRYWDTIKGIDGKLYKLYECTNCGFIFVFPSPTENFLKCYYESQYKGRCKKGIKEGDDIIEKNMGAIEDGFKKLNYIKKYSEIKNGKLLDIGCGHGFFLYAAKKLGFEATGIDVDKEAINIGMNKFGVNIIDHPIEKLEELTISYFDIITYWQVLEHLPHPGNALKKAYCLLKNGGGYNSWFSTKYPRNRRKDTGEKVVFISSS